MQGCCNVGHVGARSENVLLKMCCCINVNVGFFRPLWVWQWHRCTVVNRWRTLWKRASVIICIYQNHLNCKPSAQQDPHSPSQWLKAYKHHKCKASVQSRQKVEREHTELFIITQYTAKYTFKGMYSGPVGCYILRVCYLTCIPIIHLLTFHMCKVAVLTTKHCMDTTHNMCASRKLTLLCFLDFLFL